MERSQSAVELTVIGIFIGRSLPVIPLRITYNLFLTVKYRYVLLHLESLTFKIFLLLIFRLNYRFVNLIHSVRNLNYCRSWYFRCTGICISLTKKWLKITNKQKCSSGKLSVIYFAFCYTIVSFSRRWSPTCYSERN